MANDAEKWKEIAKGLQIALLRLASKWGVACVHPNAQVDCAVCNTDKALAAYEAAKREEG